MVTLNWITVVIYLPSDKRGSLIKLPCERCQFILESEEDTSGEYLLGRTIQFLLILACPVRCHQTVHKRMDNPGMDGPRTLESSPGDSLLVAQREVLDRVGVAHVG